MVVKYLPYFLAKTESLENPLPRSFLVRSLRGFAGDLEEGSLLCLLRTLRIYLEKTKSCRGMSVSLFVSPSCPKRSISKNAISFFLREVISDSGAVWGVGGQSLRTHSVRGMATSVVRSERAK